MFEDIKNWLHIKTEQISVYVRNLYYPSLPYWVFLDILNHFSQGSKLSNLGILGWNSKKKTSYFKSAPLNFAKCKVSCKTKKFKFETNTASFVYFWLQFQKTIFIFEINTRAFLKQQSFLQNEKSLNMAPKTPYLNTFRPEFDKFITIFEISTFEFLKKQSFMLKKNKFGTKIVLFGYL